MSFFKKMLSRVGVGSASVETELFSEEFVPGQPVTGIVNIEGGSVEQEIDAIYFKVKSTYEDEVELEGDDGDEEEIDIVREAELFSFQVSESFSLKPGEQVSFDLDFILPSDTPVTAGKTVTWVETGLDIKMALDPGDKDYIKVLPHPMVDQVLLSMETLGFQISEVVCEPAPAVFNMRLPFVQEFELKPVTGAFQSRLDEVELIFRPRASSVEVFMEVDRRARGAWGNILEKIGADETMIRFDIHEADLGALNIKLNDLIEQVL